MELDRTPYTVDTPLAEGVVVSGYNFREVAPEMLSPLSWSIVGAGMEEGFRSVARHVGVAPSTPLPRFTAYVAFRPFHQMTDIERIVARVPGLNREDCWEFLLGGPPPVKHERPAAFSAWSHVAAAVGELALARSTTQLFGSAATAVARAELATGAALSSRSPWSVGSAADAAIAGGRTAWALHVVTTCAVVVGAGLFRRMAARLFDEATSDELLRSVVARANRASPSLAAVTGDDEELARMKSYEVADRSTLFGASPGVGQKSDLASADSRDVSELIPVGTALTRGLRRYVEILGRLISEREASKVLGLRSLHCARRLLDDNLLGDVDGVSLLGAHELRAGSCGATDARVGYRREALELARAAEVPMTFRVRSGALQSLDRRPSAESGEMHGMALAPGWATGPVSTVPAESHGRVLVGRAVDGHDVLFAQPAAVVTELGSLLSHVAIVCRELGIPLVAGIRADGLTQGMPVVVDGWRGRVMLDGRGA